ncbi:hypothetical protein ANRL2_03929 [Anaerolineae bacterium]|jgi:hypothetical protein|nr:hypothetical protein ANRL2_03929 [Anaerolineae bacterium]
MRLKNEIPEPDGDGREIDHRNHNGGFIAPDKLCKLKKHDT